MTMDERAKKQERPTSNVRPFIPRTALSAAKAKEGLPPVAGAGARARGCNVVDNDDDPGPSAA